jgi:hypothetical protein
VNRLVAFGGAIDPGGSVLTQNTIPDPKTGYPVADFYNFPGSVCNLSQWKFDIGVIYALHHEPVSIVQ